MYTQRWPCLKDIEIPELIDDEAMQLIRLKEQPCLVLPLDVHEGSEENRLQLDTP